MCRAAQQSAARGRNSEGRFHFYETLQSPAAVIKGIYMCVCVRPFVVLTAHGNTTGFLICLPQWIYWERWRSLDLTVPKLSFFLKSRTAVILLRNLDLFLETRKCGKFPLCEEWNSFERASDNNISSITMLWGQQSTLKSPLAALSLSSCCSFSASWFKHAHTHTSVCLLWVKT